MEHRPNMYRIKSSDHLAQLMDDNVLSCRKLALEAGCSKTTIGDLWSGRRSVVKQSIARGIAEAFEATLEDLFEPCDRVAWQRTDGATGTAAGRTV